MSTFIDCYLSYILKPGVKKTFRKKSYILKPCVKKTVRKEYTC